MSYLETLPKLDNFGLLSSTEYSRNKISIFDVIYKSMQKVQVFLAQTGILAAYPEKFSSSKFSKIRDRGNDYGMI